MIGVLEALALAALTFFLLRLDEHSSMAPDTAYYLALAKGEKVPRPFCGRWLLPLLLRDRIRWWGVMVAACFLVGSAAMYTLAGGSLVAAALWLWLPNTRFHLRHPVLVDLPGIVLPMAAAAWVPHEWRYVAPMALLIGAVREWGVIWYAVLLMSPWPLVGLASVAFGYGRFGREMQEGDNPFITNPFSTISRYRMGHVFNWKLMLLPWGMVLPMALISGQFNWWVFLLAYLPLIIATDHARIYLYAAPVLILMALAAPIPASWWGAVLLLHVFNPYRGA